MSMKETLKKIKEQQVFAEENIEEGPRETMGARIGRKNQAINQIERLKKDYAIDLRNTAAFIVILGDKREEFTSIANEGFKCFSTDPETFFSNLVDKIPESTYLGRESMSNVFDILSRHLEDKMLGLEAVTGYPQLIFRQHYQMSLKNRQEFLSLVKKALTEQLGGEIVGIQAIQSLTGEAIKRGHAAKYAPILLPTGDESFGLTIATDLEKISDRVFLIKAGQMETDSIKCDISLDEVTEETVKKTLKTISNQLTK